MKPSIPKGTRDFGPDKVRKRDYIFRQIKSVFTKYGFHPIETPSMESLETLTGKYGEEGDQLLFKVLNNGDFLSAVEDDLMIQKNSKEILPLISKRGLRYDLTVPFARFVVMHQNELSFPFKRYQIQQVWRADRPQRGRYQEFYQCDADVVGSTSLIQEAEFISIYDEVFSKLGIKVVIKFNHRSILSGLAKICDQEENFSKMTNLIDKVDKIGLENIKEPLENIGFTLTQVNKLFDLLKNNSLDQIRNESANDSETLQAILDIEKIYSLITPLSLKNKVVIDLTLARGLTYYTGCIFEVVLDQSSYPNLKMGSLGGGGRYANLTEVFGLSGVSGAGISFGAERIYDVMEELDLFPPSVGQQLPIILLPLDEESLEYTFQILSQLRKEDIPCDMYPETVKLKKQLKYASDMSFGYAGILGTQEMSSGKIALKNLNTGSQELITLEELVQKMKNEAFI
jgi:histidyl-tRNA synthetase